MGICLRKENLEVGRQIDFVSLHISLKMWSWDRKNHVCAHVEEWERLDDTLIGTHVQLLRNSSTAKPRVDVASRIRQMLQGIMK